MVNEPVEIKYPYSSREEHLKDFLDAKSMCNRLPSGVYEFDAQGRMISERPPCKPEVLPWAKDGEQASGQ